MGPVRTLLDYWAGRSAKRVRRCRSRCSVSGHARRRATRLLGGRNRGEGPRSHRVPHARQRQKQAAAAPAARWRKCSPRSRPARPRNWPVVVKADVQGSVEAIINSLQLSRPTRSRSACCIPRWAASTKATSPWPGRPGHDHRLQRPRQSRRRGARKRDHVDIRYYSIIYNVVDDVKAALSGMLAPSLREKFLGNAGSAKSSTSPRPARSRAA